MVRANSRRDDPFATLGVEAVPLDAFEATVTDDDLLVFDGDDEAAWVKSSLYLPRAAMR